MRSDTSNAHAIIQSLRTKGFSHQEIGERIGVSQPTISRWGNRKSAPNKAVYAALVEMHEALLPNSPASENQKHSAKTLGNARVSVPVDRTLLELASDLGLDLEALFARVGTAAVRTEIKRLWQEQNKSAIEARNAYFEKHGLPLARYRSL